MFSFLSKFQHKKEMRESKDEILVGEIVRVMARLGNPAIGFSANMGKQSIRFKPTRDTLLFSIVITLDRKTGGTAIQEALIGSKATLTIQTNVKNYIADPDDLIQMYKTDVQNILKVPILGGIRLDHQINTVFATKQVIIDIGKHIPKDEKGVERLSQFLVEHINELRNKLAPYKKW
ncbi:MAG: hypothetical protein B6242_03925 [Anaerolineaceae bacterium 4572_78]|nr:MAG: hypothetical protein B6242_03925 [Anaerolineaceae bacterium 4572_78]